MKYMGYDPTSVAAFVEAFIASDQPTALAAEQRIIASFMGDKAKTMVTSLVDAMLATFLRRGVTPSAGVLHALVMGFLMGSAYAIDNAAEFKEISELERLLKK